MQALDLTIESGKLGTLLGFFPVFSNRIVQYKAQEFVFSDLSKRLNLHGHGAFIEAARTVNYFTYGEPMIHNKEEEKCKWDPVNPDARNCKEPELTGGARDFAEELPELSVAFVKEDGARQSPNSLLLICDWDENGSCWTSVVTDHGLCFTNYQISGVFNPSCSRQSLTKIPFLLSQVG